MAMDRRPTNPAHTPIVGGYRACTSPAPAPPSQPSRSAIGSFNRSVSPARHTRDAAKMGDKRDQQEDKPSASATEPSPSGSAWRLAQQLRRLEVQAFPESHRQEEATASKARIRLHDTQSTTDRTQTPASPSIMALQSRVAAPTTFGQELADVAMLHSTPHWASGAHALTSARLLMWGQARQQHAESQSQSTSPRTESPSLPEPTTSQRQSFLDTARLAPFQDGPYYHTTTGTRNNIYGMDNNHALSMAYQPEEKSEDMEIDVLLDDASLDMLVTTLARETARFETNSGPSGRQSVLYSRRNQNHEREDEDDEDNQRSELEHDDYSELSSAESSNPSTSGSNKSALRQQGKGKTNKPKRVRRACVVPGCGKRSRSLGLCIAHGGGRRCVVEGCDKSSQGGNLCIKHGGGKRCSVDGCEKAAQTNSLCKAHGGGPRCQYGDCQKSSQGGGYCRQHGGGKRCAFEGCMKGTQRGSYCALHGGSRLCVVDGCRRNDRGGGYCAHHGGGRRCTVPDCTRPSRRNALCSTHLRVLGKDGHNLDELNESIDLGIKRTFGASRTPTPSPSPSPPPHGGRR